MFCVIVNRSFEFIPLARKMRMRLNASQSSRFQTNMGNILVEGEFAIGEAVEVQKAGVSGLICSTKATLGYPDGIYCVKHGSEQRPEYSWFHTKHIALQPDMERTAA